VLPPMKGLDDAGVSSTMATHHNTGDDESETRPEQLDDPAPELGRPGPQVGAGEDGHEHEGLELFGVEGEAEQHRAEDEPHRATRLEG